MRVVSARSTARPSHGAVFGKKFLSAQALCNAHCKISTRLEGCPRRALGAMHGCRAAPASGRRSDIVSDAVPNNLRTGMAGEADAFFAGRVATLSLGVLCMVVGLSLHLDVVLTSFQTSFQTTSALLNWLKYHFSLYQIKVVIYIYIIHIIYLLTSFQTSFPLNYILQGTWILRFRCGAASYLFIKQPVGRSHLNLLLGGYEPSSHGHWSKFWCERDRKFTTISVFSCQTFWAAQYTTNTAPITCLKIPQFSREFPLCKHTTFPVSMFSWFFPSKQGHYMPPNHTLHLSCSGNPEKYHTLIASSLISPQKKWVHPQSWTACSWKKREGSGTIKIHPIEDVSPIEHMVIFQPR